MDCGWNVDVDCGWNVDVDCVWNAAVERAGGLCVCTYDTLSTLSGWRV